MLFWPTSVLQHAHQLKELVFEALEPSTATRNRMGGGRAGLGNHLLWARPRTHTPCSPEVACGFVCESLRIGADLLDTLDSERQAMSNERREIAGWCCCCWAVRCGAVRHSAVRCAARGGAGAVMCPRRDEVLDPVFEKGVLKAQSSKTWSARGVKLPAQTGNLD